MTLTAGSVRRVDFILKVGDRTEQIEIIETPAGVNTENTRLAETVNATEIANLPLNGRNVYDLIQYAPGATNMRGIMYETARIR